MRTTTGHWYLAELRRFVDSINPVAVLLAETDVAPPQYNFLWLSLARRETAPITRALQALPAAPAAGQYVVWLRNHDELDLEQLTEQERSAVLQELAPDPEMHLFGRGARRRATPMHEISRLVRVRRQVPEIGLGQWHIVETGCASVLGVRYDADRTSVITLVNVGDQEVEVQPRAFEELDHLGDVLADSTYDRPEAGRPVRLAPHGFRWVRGRPRF